MHAVRLHAFGPAENLVLEKVEDPEPGPGQVRVSVQAAGVHLVDTALREGLSLGPVPLATLPTVPGREIAGRVEAVGSGVDPAWLGRRVAAHLGMVPGGYAELAVTDVGRLHRLPDRVSEDQAVAAVGTGRTAMGVLRFTELSDRDTVLVLAAAGGVGSLLTQYALHAGAHVVGAAGGPDKVAAVRSLGAHLAVDYRQPDWAGTVRGALGGRPVTHVLEGVGGTLAGDAVSLLADGGTHLSYGYASTGFDPSGQFLADTDTLRARGITSQSVLGEPMFAKVGGRENLRVLEEEAVRLVAEGVLTPLVHHFPLADAAAAHRALQSRATLGKVVLVP